MEGEMSQVEPIAHTHSRPTSNSQSHENRAIYGLHPRRRVLAGSRCSHCSTNLAQRLVFHNIIGLIFPFFLCLGANTSTLPRCGQIDEKGLNNVTIMRTLLHPNIISFTESIKVCTHRRNH